MHEVEAYMSVIAGEANMWSRRYLQNKLMQTYDNRISVTSEGYRSIISLTDTVKHAEIIPVKDDRDSKMEVDDIKERLEELPKNFLVSIQSVIQAIREDIFKRKNTFSGSLSNEHQDEHMSPLLLATISLLIDGEMKTKNRSCSQAAMTVSGLITFNIHKLQKSPNSNIIHRRHNKKQETPVSIYVGLKIYSTVRSRNLIQRLFELGICISYDRILSITKSVYESLQKNFARYGVFLPTNIQKGHFVVLVKDNIDKNATANLVQSHYHGTSISLLQFPNPEIPGEKLDSTNFVDAAYRLKKLAPLPAEYTMPKEVHRSSDDFFAPECAHMFSDLDNFPEVNSAKIEEQKWLHQFAESINNA